MKRGDRTFGQKVEIAAWRRRQFWHPHQLRHNAGTRIAREYGVTDAQVVLGHQHLQTTEIYAERDLTRAIRIAEATG